MAITRANIINSLKRLERDWPKDGLMLFANGNCLYLCTKHPQGGGKVIETFAIPSDGGDPDWEDSADKRREREIREG